ncbi:MAG: aminomethyl-transferring glycine dehydrogenase subunit GcvPA, partial [Elusimicrobia bacterium]|nr:aminomethyl-transferring glycine dehydrogenase subunit GcvPA [Elusimicrobiota bacterium]MBD3411920.1 aminomethyl-transferring glycine dehydrogenase subunit GcvPA [Elusimicrobiota bacterium]
MDFIPHTEKDTKDMLAMINVDSIDQLFSSIPEELKKHSFNLPPGLSEHELIAYFKRLGEKNSAPHAYQCFRGAGAYEHYIPAVVKSLASRGEFVTSYTPYQPEVSQGTLQAMYEYQSMIASLTRMDAANASLYDGPTAMAEAAFLAVNATGRKRILVSKTVHPEYRTVLKTFMQGMDVEVMDIPYFDYGITDMRFIEEILSPNTAAVIVQSPNFFGVIEKLEDIADRAHRVGALCITAANPVAMALLKPPGALGADIVVGEGQALGNPLYYGGPYLGFFAVKSQFMRKMPGRISGKTIDKDGKTGFVLTLQTREQHIRREKATSNICSN